MEPSQSSTQPFVVRTLAKFSPSIIENLHEKANPEDKKRLLKMQYLYFDKGDKIKVLKSPSHGWWYGKLLKNFTDMFEETDSRYQCVPLSNFLYGFYDLKLVYNISLTCLDKQLYKYFF
jgi:hypothetical protein